MTVPIVDLHSNNVSEQITQACREFGFFYITNHGVDETLIRDLDHASRKFFFQDLQTKMQIAMSKGGRAWRGYFPVGGELTSGQPDLKEGIYFGAELSDDHPMVQAAVPLHGRNLFPKTIPELRDLVLNYLTAMTTLGHQLASALSIDSYYTNDPLILFRIFNYPAPSQPALGVGEHTDYGFLTILRQDSSGGLQIKHRGRWIDAPPIPNSFVCNVGDMLERLTGGRYVSAPHRVVNAGAADRLSFAFFFDPNFNAEVKPITLPIQDTKEQRWDHASVLEFQGTYGDYLLGKISKVFPDLFRRVH